MTHHPWTTTQEAQLRTMFVAGETDEQMATQLRVTCKAISKRRHKLRLLRPPNAFRRMTRNKTGQFTGAAATVLLLCSSAFAAPPPGADSRLEPFFESLHLQNHPGIGCCGVSDCRDVESRSPANSPSGHWEANITPEVFGSGAPGWTVVPDTMVQDAASGLFRPPRAIACWSKVHYIFSDNHTGLMCFITPATSG